MGTKLNLKDVSQLNNELSEVGSTFGDYHDKMQDCLDGYNDNYYYSNQPHMPSGGRSGVNFISVFADKNWHYLSPFPKINVPSAPNDAENADIREKILVGTWQANDGDLLWSKFTYDGTTMSACANITNFNLKTRKIEYTRLDPRRVYWQKSDSSGGGMDVIWHILPMTLTAIKRKYGVDVTGQSTALDDMLNTSSSNQGMRLDQTDLYNVITRCDKETTTIWCGKKLIRTYKHLLGDNPIDICLPYPIADTEVKGDFYIQKLKGLQAEFNYYWQRRAKVVEKLGDPLIWGRGVYKNQLKDMKEATTSGGGFVGMTENGELGILTIPETKMIDTALTDVFQKMKDIAGFPTATFGEIAGANTSGDALGMYFQPTTRHIEHQAIAYKSFVRRINAKTLKFLHNFMLPNETLSVDGYLQGGKDGGVNTFSEQFTKETIGNNYNNVVTTQVVTPKDDLAYKRLMLEMARDKVVSRQSAFDEAGFLSPQDEVERLKVEQQEPALNPEGTSQIMQGAQTAQALMQPPEPVMPQMGATNGS